MRPSSPILRPIAGFLRLPTLAAALTLAAGCASVAPSAPGGAPPAAGDASAQQDRRDAHWNFAAQARPPADRDGYRPPLKLAVLLPLSGQLATAAAPVRDGLLAGYYGERRQRPELVFYDTIGTAAGAVTAYTRALAEGADQVLGPLGRDEIAAVYAQARPDVPMIALNRSPQEPPPNIASFSLAPEDDGADAADLLLARGGGRQVLVLAGDGDYARRAVASFNAQLQLKGGQVAQTLPVTGDKPADLSAALQAVVQRPQAIDAIFLALRGVQALAIAPQLAAAGLAGKPRVATSQLTAGIGKNGPGLDLDGIAFPTDAWSVIGAPGLPSAGQAGAELPTARGAAAKLFAFGHDAWLLSVYLEHLASRPQARLEGATGQLQLGPRGHVQRRPAWAAFGNGQVIPIAPASEAIPAHAP